MATKGFINGTITKIKFFDEATNTEISIDQQIEANFTFGRELIGFLNKDSGGYTKYKAGKVDWSVSGKAHLRFDADTNFEYLLNAMKSKTTLTLLFTTGTAGDIELGGQAFIESLNISTGTEAGVEFDYSFKGSGEPFFSPSVYYGVSWDATADTYARLGSLSGLPVSQSPGNDYLSIHRLMKKCLLHDDGSRNYYIDPDNPINKSGDVVINSGTVTSKATTAVTDEAFTSSLNNFVQLANMNIDPDTSPNVTSSDGATTYTYGSDYLIDRQNGWIKVLSTGTMANATGYLIDYSYINPVLIDASANFVAGGVAVGMAVKNVNSGKIMLVESVDSSTQLTLKHSIFNTNDSYQVGTANYGGADGQVMVEIPKFYFKQSFSGNTRSWMISLYELPGFTLHPAFVKDGVEVDYRYYSAFEGSMYDASAAAMTASGSIATDLYAAGDKMCSVAGQWAKTNETRAEYRTMAAERGTGWRQLDYYLNSAVQLLYLIEYADFNSQAMIGNGRTALSGGAWAADSYIGMTGLSVGDGNGTNSVSNGSTLGYLTDYMSYRGIENWYGNVWKMLEGITWDGRWTGAPAAQPLYVTNNATDFLDYGIGNLTHLVDAPYIGSDAGYISDIGNVLGFIPSAALGSSSTQLCDYYYQYSQSTRDYWRVVLFGSDAVYGGPAGGFALYAINAWSDATVYIAGRLCF